MSPHGRSEGFLPAVFFDRDGVLNVDHGYAYRPDEWEWMPGAIVAIRDLNQLGFLTVVVTNQSGIARGYYSEEDLNRLHAWVQEDLRGHGAHLDAIYFCPHGPDDDCDCRKPKPGMIRSAIEDLRIDTRCSFLIGDKDSDIAAARAAGIPGFKFSGGDLRAFVFDHLPSIPKYP